MRAAVAQAVALDIVIIAPVNDRPAPAPGAPLAVYYPAAYEQVIAVGGVNAIGGATEASAAAAGVDLLALAPMTHIIGPRTAGPMKISIITRSAAASEGPSSPDADRWPAPRAGPRLLDTDLAGRHLRAISSRWTTEHHRGHGSPPLRHGGPRSGPNRLYNGTAPALGHGRKKFLSSP